MQTPKRDSHRAACKTPHLQIEVRLVTYGYQLDLYDHTLATADGQNVIHRMECHDWSSDKLICERAQQIGDAVITAVKKLK